MKNINEYINEAKLTEIQQNQINGAATYAADAICINLGYIDFLNSLFNADKDTTVDLMFDISQSVHQYNDKVPSMFKKYCGGSQTNVTCGDWRAFIVDCLYPEDRDDYKKQTKNSEKIHKEIIKDVEKPFSALGTSYSKEPLSRIYDMFKEKINKTDLKRIIKELKDEMQSIKVKQKERIDNIKNNNR